MVLGIRIYSYWEMNMADNDKVRQVLRSMLNEALDIDIAKREAEIMAISSVIEANGGEMQESPIYACHVVALGMLSLKRLVAEHDARLAAEIAAMVMIFFMVLAPCPMCIQGWSRPCGSVQDRDRLSRERAGESFTVS